MHGFWIEWRTETGVRLPIGCAVTAYDLDDALEQIRAVYAPEVDSLPAPTSIQEGVTFEEVEAQIGRADFGVPVLRGIWYPHLENP
jgi:hypothetical protein